MPPLRALRRAPIAALLLALALALSACEIRRDSPAAQTSSAPRTPGVAVVRVVDGDTVDVRLPEGRRERVRLIGMDTPETVDPRVPVQCFGREASARAHALLDGQTVGLERDSSQGERDRYGRLLAYLWLPDGRDFAQVMIGEGYAFEYTYRLPYAHQEEFQAAEAGAREHALGLWAPETCAGRAVPADRVGGAPTPGPGVTPAPGGPSPSSPPPPRGTVPAPTATPPAGAPPVRTPPGFDPAAYVGRGDAFDCGHFRSQADAQAVLRADPRDPNRLDGDRDGVACEANAPPLDLQRVPR
jgi:micrococcal nuclease